MRYIAIFAIVLLLLTGCAANVTIKDINDDPAKFMGKKVVIKGKVVVPLQMGSVSGFSLKDDSGSIMVSSDSVPEAGSEVTVKGIVVKGLFTSHYIFAEQVD